jgi:hypothetical protein
MPSIEQSVAKISGDVKVTARAWNFGNFLSIRLFKMPKGRQRSRVGYPASPRKTIPTSISSLGYSLTTASTSLFPTAHIAKISPKSEMSFSRLQQRPNLHLERRGNIFIITLQKPPENRLNTKFCQDIIATFHYIQRLLGPLSEGAVITRGNDAKFFCTGVELDEADSNPFANSDGFYPMLHTILDFPYPTIALLTGHTFGGACPFALAHDYRVMNSKRGFIQMVSLNFRKP